MSNNGLSAWHEVVKSKDLTRLKDLIADGAVFHSPLVHTPQEGKALTLAYLGPVNTTKMATAECIFSSSSVSRCAV